MPLVAGGSIVFQQRFDAQQTLDAIARYQVTALFQVPTQLQRIAALAGFSTADLSSLRAVGWGGGPLPLEVIRRYRRLGVALTATYGATEVTSSVTYTDPDADDEVLAATVGRPDPELDVRLLTDDGRWGEAGEEGEVCVRHPSVMAGYYHRPADTAAVFTADGWLRTGDRGLLREDGNLRLIARYKEMFKSGGYNIYPREIELALESHPAVAAAAVVSRPDAGLPGGGCRLRRAATRDRGDRRRTRRLVPATARQLQSARSRSTSSTACRCCPWARSTGRCLPGQPPSDPPLPTGSGRPQPGERPGAEGFLEPPGHTLRPRFCAAAEDKRERFKSPSDTR